MAMLSLSSCLCIVVIRSTAVDTEMGEGSVTYRMQAASESARPGRGPPLVIVIDRGVSRIL